MTSQKRNQIIACTYECFHNFLHENTPQLKNKNHCPFLKIIIARKRKKLFFELIQKKYAKYNDHDLARRFIIVPKLREWLQQKPLKDIATSNYIYPHKEYIVIAKTIRKRRQPTELQLLSIYPR